MNRLAASTQSLRQSWTYERTWIGRRSQSMWTATIQRARVVAPPALTLAIASFLVSPAPSEAKLGITAASAVLALREVGRRLALSLVFGIRGRRSYASGFALLSTFTGLALFGIVDLLDRPLAYWTAAATVGLVATIIAPLSLGGLAHRSMAFDRFVLTRTAAKGVRPEEQIALYARGGTVGNILWFAFVSGMNGVLVCTTATLLSTSLLFPPVASAIALVYAFWLVARRRNLASILPAVRWTKGIDLSILTPLVGLGAQLRIVFMLIVVATLVALVLVPALVFLILSALFESVTLRTSASTAPLLILAQVGPWYWIEIMLTVSLLRRVRWFVTGSAAACPPLQTRRALSAVAMGNVALAALVLLSAELPPSAPKFAWQVGIVGASWGVGLLWILMRRTRIVDTFEEESERRTWALLFVIASLPAWAVGDVLGFGMGVAVAALLFTEVAALQELHDLLMRRLPKRDEPGNFLLHHLALFPAEGVLLGTALLFFSVVDLQLLGLVVVGAGSLLILLGRLGEAYLDYRMGWALPAGAKPTLVEILTNNAIGLGGRRLASHLLKIKIPIGVKNRGLEAHDADDDFAV